ncbi:hypothetical protein AB0D08_34560 [Kitasatospora sp. NPDC048540]|uniref:hypothetical protein n=1 Tax=Kitasatospora sp. NPDC048540 TaxID=3155634 RepID=UPI0033C1CDE9
MTSNFRDHRDFETPLTVGLRESANPFTSLFDVLADGDQDLTGQSYLQCRRRLEQLPLAHPRIMVPPAWIGDADAALRFTTDHHLEGVVAKALASPCRPDAGTPPGRSCAAPPPPTC